MMSRLKKLNRRDLFDRDDEGAIVYIDGEIVKGKTHGEAINKYIQSKTNSSLNDKYYRPYIYNQNQSQNPDDYSWGSVEDIEIIKENIKQIAFAHIVSTDGIIYIEQNTLQNIDINIVANAMKEQYPEYDICLDETDEKIARLKKINSNHDIGDRDCAIVYIDGKIIEDETHAGCINYYLKMNINKSLYDTSGRPYKFDNELPNSYKINEQDKYDMELIEQNVNQLAFAHKIDQEGAIYIEQDTLQNIDINTIANAIKIRYPDYDIYIDETDEKVARLKKKKMQKTANYVTNDFDSFFLGSGDVIAIGCRLVNNKPRYQVYQEGLYCSSSYYDGDDYDRALQMYKDLMTAFDGVGKTEGFAESEAKIKENIKSLINEKKDDDYNFDKLKSDPLFLGVNRNDW